MATWLGSRSSEGNIVHLVAYDLLTPNDTEEDYGRVIAAIKNLGPWAHLQQSVWLTAAALSADEIQEALLPSLSAEDRLFIAALGEWTATNATPGRLEWLRNRSVMIGDDK